MSISDNPETEDKITAFKPYHPMNPWVIKILENSNPDLTEMILKSHDVTVTLVMKKTGKIDSTATDVYKQLFNLVITNQGYKITPEMQVVVGVQFNLKNPYDGLSFKKEERKYRRNRKKINWINNKTLLEVILDCEQEVNGKNGLRLISVRKSLESNPDKDKDIIISNMISDLLVKLLPYCSPKLNENYSVMLDEFYTNLMNDITSTKEGEVYNKTKLIQFIANNREEQKELALSLYEKMYKKVNLPLSSSPNKKGELKFAVNKEPKEIIELYRMKDIDTIRLINRIEYLDLTNIL